ncbi:hypothetical protein FKG96_10100 [Olivibacter sp. LS-1]|uniref:hypothetical protein n=1 Tax=Olivibacter sp. LS-1 TaxID=2592345 RepID=UPI0011EAEB9D|nr:hypothetical protein [Olivibacter sp. LS-1]QEL01145.1 hypothetical protein FKG96_10100 [Olivibacter sp. LS-1]
MPVPKLPISFPSFVKYPLQAVTYLLLAYFVYKEFTQKDECKELREMNKILQKRVEYLEKQVSDQFKQMDDFKNALLVKQGVIDRVQTKLDSIKTTP